MCSRGWTALGSGASFAQRKMGPCPVIIGKVRLQNLQEMALTENDDVIEALSPYGSDKPLDIWILPRGKSASDSSELLR